MAEVEIRVQLLPPYDNNCYVLVSPDTKESIIVDAPSDPDRILELAHDTTVRYVVITHNHADHWGALKELKERLQTQVAAHQADAQALPIPLDLPLKDSDVLRIGGTEVSVIHTPGHTPGSICLLVGKHLITGDTLFPNGPGHSRTPDNLRQMIASITSKLFVLPDDTRVYPGHGAGTVLGPEKQNYGVFASKPHDPNLAGDVTWTDS